MVYRYRVGFWKCFIGAKQDYGIWVIGAEQDYGICFSGAEQDYGI